ncbi:hypothetical protein ACTFIY_000827 [Dictyostelium cf. discoideum]
MGISDQINSNLSSQSPFTVSTNPSDSMFLPTNRIAKTADWKEEKKYYYPKESIQSIDEGTTVRIAIDKQNGRLYGLEMVVEIGPLTATGGTFTRLCRDVAHSMAYSVSIWNGNNEIQRLHMDHERIKMVLTKLKHERDMEDKMAGYYDDATRTALGATKQKLIFDLNFFHTIHTSDALYLNATALEYTYQIKINPLRRWVETDGTDPKANDFKVYLRAGIIHTPQDEYRIVHNTINTGTGIFSPIEHTEMKERVILNIGESKHYVQLTNIIGNGRSYFVVLRRLADTENPKAPRYDDFMPWENMRLLHAGNEEVHSPHINMMDCFKHLKHRFHFDASSNDDKSPNRMNIYGFSFSANPIDVKNQTGCFSFSQANNLQLEVTIKTLTEPWVLDFYTASTQIIQQSGNTAKTIFHY